MGQFILVFVLIVSSLSASSDYIEDRPQIKEVRIIPPKPDFHSVELAYDEEKGLQAIFTKQKSQSGPTDQSLIPEQTIITDQYRSGEKEFYSTNKLTIQATAESTACLREFVIFKKDGASQICVRGSVDFLDPFRAPFFVANFKEIILVYRLLNKPVETADDMGQ